jgi:hypothetical protein
MTTFVAFAGKNGEATMSCADRPGYGGTFDQTTVTLKAPGRSRGLVLEELEFDFDHIGRQVFEKHLELKLGNAIGFDALANLPKNWMPAHFSRGLMTQEIGMSEDEVKKKILDLNG